jgi:hypothetical protein
MIEAPAGVRPIHQSRITYHLLKAPFPAYVSQLSTLNEQLFFGGTDHRSLITDHERLRRFFVRLLF